VIITPWINLINGQLNKGDCALSMMDSSTAEGWMRKTNFIKTGDNKIQAKAHADAAQHHTHLFMDGNIKGYSPWFSGKENNVTDALSCDWHQDNEELTSILHFHFPSQMPNHFVILPLPSKIDSWLTLLLW
jgi:hypothetical protein